MELRAPAAGEHAPVPLEESGEVVERLRCERLDGEVRHAGNVLRAPAPPGAALEMTGRSGFDGSGQRLGARHLRTRPAPARAITTTHPATNSASPTSPPTSAAVAPPRNQPIAPAPP